MLIIGGLSDINANSSGATYGLWGSSLLYTFYHNKQIKQNNS